MQDAKVKDKSDKKALNRLQSPDDLDQYLRMTSPGLWISVVACVAILLGIAAWAVFGSVSDHITMTGVAIEGGIACIVDSDNALRIKEGDFAYVDGVPEKVTYVDEWAYETSRHAEVDLTDLEIHRLAGGTEKVHPIIISDSQNLEYKKSVQVTITVEQKTPLAMVFGK